MIANCDRDGPVNGLVDLDEERFEQFAISDRRGRTDQCGMPGLDKRSTLNEEHSQTHRKRDQLDRFHLPGR